MCCEMIFSSHYLYFFKKDVQVLLIKMSYFTDAITGSRMMYGGGHSLSSGLEQRVSHAPMYFSSRDVERHSPSTYFNQQSGGSTRATPSLYSIIVAVKQYTTRAYESLATQIHFTPEYAFDSDNYR